MDSDQKRTYSSETLGLPPLKMVLVHAENDRQNEAAQAILESPKAREKREKQKVIVKLIKHLNDE
ncbi:MAG TPA: hypothetical protein VLZ89_08930 [Anaerolineales bacterium]|nr:hypothetical protein [Anaerolineales bacterium]